MTSDVIFALIASLVLTIAFEMLFFFIFCIVTPVFIKKQAKKDLLLLVFVNIITNPIVVLLYWLTVLYTGLNLFAVKALLEIFAILTEGYYYKKYGQQFKHPWLFAIASNAFSFGIGVLLQLYIY